jgi:type VI secretion system protein ImpH
MSIAPFDFPARYEFFQAVRMLQLAAPERAAVGYDAEPNLEAVRFESDISLTFPTSEIAELRASSGADRAPVMRVAFMGIATPASFGSLPMPYCLAIREQRGAQTAREFVDLFNHRLIALFYRAWEKYRFGIAYERQSGLGTFENALLALVGAGMPALRDRLPLDDRALLFGAGGLSRRPMSRRALESALSNQFELPVRVRSFEPAWQTLKAESRIGVRGELGRDAFLGTRILLAQHRFRIVAGPMPRERFEDLLPACAGPDPRAAGLGLRSLVAMARFASGSEYEFDLELVLRSDQVAPLRLARAIVDPSEPQARLGWSTWLRSTTRDDDARTTLSWQAVHTADPPGAAVAEADETMEAVLR